jgi:hypothetical protein
MRHLIDADLHAWIVQPSTIILKSKEKGELLRRCYPWRPVKSAEECIDAS